MNDTIIVHSIDYDGCLGYRTYPKNPKDPFNLNPFDGNEILINSNKDFIAQLLKATDEFNQTIIMVGSNRQTAQLDATNSYKHQNGSCFLALSHLVKHMHTLLAKKGAAPRVEFDTYLIADSYNRTKPGTSFTEVMSYYKNFDPIAQFPTSSSVPIDRSKLDIFYAQIHKIACEHPNSVIQFCFYDDSTTTLGNLTTLFASNRDLIPRNVNLQFIHYKEGTLRKYSEEGLQGIGFCDQEYSETIMEMAKMDDWTENQDADQFILHLCHCFSSSDKMAALKLKQGIKGHNQTVRGTKGSGLFSEDSGSTSQQLVDPDSNQGGLSCYRPS